MLAVHIYPLCLAFIYLPTVLLAWIVRSGADRNASGQSEPFLLCVKKMLRVSRPRKNVPLVPFLYDIDQIPSGEQTVPQDVGWEVEVEGASPVKLASLRDGFRALICPHGCDWLNIG